MNPLRKSRLTATAALLLSLNVFASGVPTIDPAAFSALMQQFLTLKQQLQTMKSNVEQITNLKDNFRNQFRGEIDYYESMINNISFRKTASGYIPENASEVLSVVKSGTSANPGIQGTIDRIMNSSDALKALQPGELKTALAQSRRRMAYYQAAAEQSYNAAGAREKMAHELAKKSAKVSNEKEARALGLAMQAQNLVAINDLARQQALAQIKAAQKEEEERKIAEKNAVIFQKECKEIEASGWKLEGDYKCDK